MKLNEKITLAAFLGFVAVGTIFAQSVRMSKTVEPNAAQNHLPGVMSSSKTEHSIHQVSTVQPDSHEGHLQEKPSSKNAVIQAKLTTSSIPTQNKSTLLAINVQDSEGKAITQFDTFQEKLMHLIVVSDDLQIFQHLHPNYKGNGRFEITTTLPQAGNYTLVSDFKPTGQQEEVAILKTRVPGTVPTASGVNSTKTKTIDTTNVILNLPEPTIKANQEVTLTFDLKDTIGGQSVSDLQPYLGEEGHLVILKQSTPLTRADYVHAHAMKGAADGKVEFMTAFPQPGNYKLWGQFNRNGKIIIADFWVKVL